MNKLKEIWKRLKLFLRLEKIEEIVDIIVETEEEIAEKIRIEEDRIVAEFEKMLSTTPEALSLCHPKLSPTVNSLLLRRAVEKRGQYISENIEKYAQIISKRN